jgi:DNA-binding response OmpR family regulator
MNILAVEDDRDVAGSMEKGRAEEGYRIDPAMKGEAGLFLVSKNLRDGRRPLPA